MSGTERRTVVLVLTTVHPPEDPRVRHRTVGVLADAMPVRYAVREPGPVEVSGFQVAVLRGSRPVRALRGLREALRPDVAVVSIHDPELIPVALVARAMGRRIVIDVHEDVPAQISTKEWIPVPLRRPLAALSRAMLHLSERTGTVTLAEDNYGRLFRQRHPVLANYPVAETLPQPQVEGDGSVVYVGDVTVARGAITAVRAMAAVEGSRRLNLVGRCREPLRSRLTAMAGQLGVDLHLCGFVPHDEAMSRAAAATVGISPLVGGPNHRDSLPSKIIEYLAVGIPVVASDLPGTRRVVGGLPGLQLVPPEDIDAWASAIAAASDPAARAAAQANVGHVRATYTWPSAELRSLYLGLLGGAKHPPQHRTASTTL